MTMNEQILRILGVAETNKLDDISDSFGVYPSEADIIAAIEVELQTGNPHLENNLIASMYQEVYDRAKAYAEEKGIDPTFFSTHSGYYVNALASQFFIDGENMYSWQCIREKINEMTEEQQ